MFLTLKGASFSCVDFLYVKALCVEYDLIILIKYVFFSFESQQIYMTKNNYRNHVEKYFLIKLLHVVREFKLTIGLT